MELYYVNFLFICYKRDVAETLSTISVNTLIAVCMIASLPGSLLAEYCLGNYSTQVLGMIVVSLSTWLLVLSSWQFSVTKPSCCLPMPNISDAVALLSGNSTHSNGGLQGVHEVLLGEGLVASRLNHVNCSELTRNILFPEVSFGLSPSLLIVLCLVAVVVRMESVRCHRLLTLIIIVIFCSC